MSVGYLCCPVDVLYCDLTLVCRPISNVLSNRAGEKNWLLRQTNSHTEMRKKEAGDFLAFFVVVAGSYLAYSTDVTPQPVRIQVSYIIAINPDHTCILIKTMHSSIHFHCCYIWDISLYKYQDFPLYSYFQFSPESGS